MDLKAAQKKLNERMAKRMIGRSRATHIILDERSTSLYLGKRPYHGKTHKFKPVFNANWGKRRGQLKLGAV